MSKREEEKSAAVKFWEMVEEARERDTRRALLVEYLKGKK